MYSEQDYIDIDSRIRRNHLIGLPVLAALMALFVASLIVRIQWLAAVSAIAFACAACFGFTYFQLPCLRYRSFLRTLKEGLSREMTGEIVSVADDAEMQDGARVLHVHIMLEKEQDERIVYLNASKRDGFPPIGTRVKLKLCGRHIRAAEVL